MRSQGMSFWKICCGVLVFLCFLPSIYYKIRSSPDKDEETDVLKLDGVHSVENLFKGYLVQTPGCDLLDLDPSPQVMKSVPGEGARKECETPVIVVANRTLHFNKKHPRYGSVTCCYQEIHRVTLKTYTWMTADWTQTYSDCKPISDTDGGTKLTSEFVRITCRSGYFWRQLDYVAVVLPPEEQSTLTRSKAKKWKELKGRKPPNVLIIGIDSISRLHMKRSMPLTDRFLLQNDFIELRGYTKVGENTFPNMMAALGGMKPKDYLCLGSGGKDSKMDECPLIWKNFSSNGYVTGFVEDAAALATFNYMKTGFVAQPTDYYLRPLAVALHGKLDRDSAFHGCANGLSQTDFMIRYIQDFLHEMGASQTPFFLLSWFTTLAHDNFHGLEGNTDLNFKRFIQETVRSHGENTVILFMSDHGYRFGPLRETLLGYYEESLPFFFIRVPPTLKRLQPSWYKNLGINRNRLTTPLNLHAALMEISALSAPSNNKESKAQLDGSVIPSFFQEIRTDRTCENSFIPDNYCRCDMIAISNNKTSSLESSGVDIVSVGEFLVESVNDLLSSQVWDLCAELKLKSVLYVWPSALRNSSSSGGSGRDLTSVYIIAVEVAPSNAHFEGKIKVIHGDSPPPVFQVLGDISRTNRYGGQSRCVSDYWLKNFCYCP